MCLGLLEPSLCVVIGCLKTFSPHGLLVDSFLTGPDGCGWWDQGLNPCPGLTFLYLLIHRVREAAMTSLKDLILLLARTEPQLIEAHV